MSRGLNATIISNLNQSVYQAETLLEVITTSFSYYWTTGFTDVSLSTPTIATSHTFQTANNVTVAGQLQESYDPSLGDFTIQIDTSNVLLIEHLTTNFLKTRITAYKMFRDSTTNAADTSNLILVNDGYVTDVVLQGGQDIMTIEMKCKNLFTSLNTKKGRISHDLEPPIGVNIVWGTVQWPTS